MSNQTSNRGTVASFLLPMVAVFAVLFVFLPIVRHEFVAWDDDINIYDHPHLNPARTDPIVRIWQEPYQKMYIPVTYSVWWGLAWLTQWRESLPFVLRDHPTLFHAANLVVHLMNVLLVYWILRILSRGEAHRDGEGTFELFPPWSAAFGAVVFGLHPVQVEAVSWCTGLKDILSGFFSLVTILLVVVSFKSSQWTTKWGAYVAATIVFCLALFSKPSAIMVPFIVLLLGAGILKTSVRSLAAQLLLWFLLAFGFAWLVRDLQQAAGPSAKIPLWSRPFIAGDAIAFYLYKLTLPFRLAPDYGRTPELVLSTKTIYLAWILPVLVFGLSLLVRGTRRVAVVGVGIFLLAILPVLGLVPFQHQHISTVADRYLYLSMVGLALLLGVVHGRMVSRWGRDAHWGTVLLLAFWGALSFGQTKHWKNTVCLFEHTLVVNPRSESAHNNLAYELEAQGKIEEAKRHYEAAIEIDPTEGLALNNLGNLYLLAGETEKAINYYHQALESPDTNDVVDACGNMGLVYARLGDEYKAFYYYQKGLEYNPRAEKIHNNIAILLARKGRWEDALGHYRTALEIKPNYEDVKKNLSSLLNDFGFAKIQEGALKEAEDFLDEAIDVWPWNLRAWVNRGNVDLAQGNAEAAIALWEKALEFLPQSPELHHNLAVAWLEDNEPERAKKHLLDALRIQPAFQPSQVLLRSLDASNG